MLKPYLLIRIALGIILLMHSIPGMFNNGINDFGNLYLGPMGFGVMGIYVAWAIKLSHIGAAFCFFMNRCIKIAGSITIFILLMGIIMVHANEGWFVVGGGRNGVEFNVLLIAVMLQLILQPAVTHKVRNENSHESSKF